jgi:uncharacterized protein
MSARVSLLDVNFLIALCWKSHVFHSRASQWFGLNRSTGWATCPLTEAGFVRVFAQLPTNLVPGIVHGIRFLEKNSAEPDHRFWPHETPLTNLLPEIQGRLRGHKQLTDAVLLDLAVRKEGQLVTFDRGVRHLLKPDSIHQAVIEVVEEG